MGALALRGAVAGVREAELSRLRQLAGRLLVGRPPLPYGTSPRRLQAGRGLEFLELRSQAAADDPRDIDWRATARAGRPLVRRYQDEALFRVLLCLDRSASMRTLGRESGRESGKWELAVQVTTALVYLLLSGGNQVGLLTFSAGVDSVDLPARGRSTQARLRARLDALEPRQQGGSSRLEACARFVKPGTSVLVVSDFLAADFLGRALGQLQRRGGAVQAFQIADSAELEIGASSQALLRDIETGEERTLRLTPETRELAAGRLGELRAALRDYCRTHGIPLTSCESDTSWREVILAHVRSVGSFHTSLHA